MGQSGMRLRVICLMALLALLGGCKEVLYSNLDERQANEIVAVLHSHGISGSRASDKDGIYTVSVQSTEVGASIALLTEAGLPKDRFQSIGEVFPADSVVGTPFEERTRFIYALSQELSGTLTEITGVQSARVHIMIPEKTRFEKEIRVSTASVVIYATDAFDQESFVPKIKLLVAYAVPDLVYDNVAVALFPVEVSGMAPMSVANVPGGAQASTLGSLSFAPAMDSESLKVTSILLALFIGLLVLLTKLMRAVALRIVGRK